MVNKATKREGPSSILQYHQDGGQPNHSVHKQTNHPRGLERRRKIGRDIFNLTFFVK